MPNVIKSMRAKLSSEGVWGLALRVLRRLHPIRLASLEDCRPYTEGKIGLEVGGPSQIFGRDGLMPIYPLAGRIDNCNFSSETAWEHGLNPGFNFRFEASRAPGQQFVAEAAALDFLPDSSYDFLLSSHMLEHSANPLLVLEEWKRVLKPGGLLLLILPHKDGTFDHRRPTSTLAHLQQDFTLGTGEDDLTHLPEILKLHDLGCDPEAGSPEAFRARCLDNLRNRCIHQHVFDTSLALALVDHLGLLIVAAEQARPYHIVITAKKPETGYQPDNTRFLAASAPWRKSSPFRTDRQLH